MRQIAGFLRLALLTSLAVSAVGIVPAAARTPRPTQLYATTVELHFSGPNGKTRTITQQMYIDAGNGCASIPSFSIDQAKHPEISGMKLTSVTCKDSAGAARPGGPAIVRVKYVSADGQFRQIVIDHLGSKTYDMKSCPFAVSQDVAAFAGLIEEKSPGGKFAGAVCEARPKYTGSLLQSAN